MVTKTATDNMIGAPLPKNWTTKRLGEEAILVTKGTTPTSIGRSFTDSGVTFVKVEALYENGSIETNKLAYIDEVTHSLLRRSQLKKDDLLVSIAGALGRIGIVKDDILPANINQALAVVRLKDDAKLNLQYVFQYLNTERITKHIESISVQGAQPNLSLKNVYDLPIAAPTEVGEQIEIANVLSDVDNLISLLDLAVIKKRNMKTATMQELLTGKKRLHGYRGKWEKIKLGDLLAYEQPTRYLVKSTKYSNNYETPVLTAGKTFILGYTNETKGIFNDVPVIIFDDFTTANKYVTFPFKAKSSAMKMLRPRHDEINLRFIFEKMQLIDFKLGDHKRYWISEYQNIELEMPHPNEQTAIAAVLSDMDDEITELETRLRKTRELKQGMMQKLLTGSIRLV